MTVTATPEATLLDNLERDLGVSRPGHDEDQVDAEETLLDESAWTQIRHRRGPTLGGSSATVAPWPSLLQPMPWIAGGMQRWPARRYGADA